MRYRFGCSKVQVAYKSRISVAPAAHPRFPRMRMRGGYEKKDEGREPSFSPWLRIALVIAVPEREWRWKTASARRGEQIARCILRKKFNPSAIIIGILIKLGKNIPEFRRTSILSFLIFLIATSLDQVGRALSSSLEQNIFSVSVSCYITI